MKYVKHTHSSVRRRMPINKQHSYWNTLGSSNRILANIETGQKPSEQIKQSADKTVEKVLCELQSKYMERILQRQ